jgi:hypothetical protein
MALLLLLVCGVRFAALVVTQKVQELWHVGSVGHLHHAIGGAGVLQVCVQLVCNSARVTIAADTAAITNRLNSAMLQPTLVNLMLQCCISEHLTLAITMLPGSGTTGAALLPTTRITACGTAKHKTYDISSRWQGLYKVLLLLARTDISTYSNEVRSQCKHTACGCAPKPATPCCVLLLP